MSVKTHTGTRMPTGRAYAVTYGGAVSAALLVGAFALALDWSHTAIFIAGVILVGLYVPFAVSFLFARAKS